MAELVKVPNNCESSFNRVLPLLSELNPRLGRAGWRRLFFPGWDTEEDYCGYALEECGDVVGFHSMLFSKINTPEGPRKLCNLGSYIVRKSHRTQSLELVLPILKLQDCTLTSLTSSRTTHLIRQRLGFKELESRRTLFPLLPKFSSVCEIITDGSRLKTELPPHLRQIFLDHQAGDCQHLLARTKNSICYVIFVRRKYGRLRVASILYVSDTRVFGECLGSMALTMAWRARATHGIVDSRFVETQRMPRAKTISLEIPRLYRAPVNISPLALTSLYTELAVLPI